MNKTEVIILERAGLRFLLPSDAVISIIAQAGVQPMPWSASFMVGTLEHDNRAVAVIDLVPFLEVALAEAATAAPSQIVLVSAAGQVVGLVADKVDRPRQVDLEQEEAVLLAFGHRGNTAIQKCVRMRGDVVIVLDPAGLLDHGTEAGQAELTEETEPQEVLQGRAQMLSRARPEEDVEAKDEVEFAILPVGGEWYGVPAASVRKVFRAPWITPVPSTPPLVAGVTNLQGEILAVIDLLAARGAAPMALAQEERHVVAVRHEAYDFGLLCGPGARVISVPPTAMRPAPAVAEHGAEKLAAGLIPTEDHLVSFLDMPQLLALPALRKLMVEPTGERTPTARPAVPSSPSDQSAPPAQDELGQYLDRLYRCLKAAETPPLTTDLVDELLRVVHSIKGIATGADYRQITAQVEALVVASAQPGAVLAESSLDLLHRACVALQGLVHEEAALSPEELSGLTEELAASAQGDRQAESERIAEELPGLDPGLDALLTAADKAKLLSALDRGEAIWQVSATFTASDFAAEAEALRERLIGCGEIITSAGGAKQGAEGEHPWSFLLTNDRSLDDLNEVLVEWQGRVLAVDVATRGPATGAAQSASAEASAEQDQEAEELLRYRAMFLQMAGEMLEQLSGALLDLEKAPTDQETVNAAFRAAHSIKGAAGSVGLREIERVAHAMEAALEGPRAGTSSVSAEAMDVLLRAADAVRDLVAGAHEGTGSPAIAPGVLSDLAALVAPTAETEAPSAPSMPTATETPAPAASATRSSPRVELGESIRVPMLKLDALSNLTSELVTIQTSIDLHHSRLQEVARLGRMLADGRSGEAGAGVSDVAPIAQLAEGLEVLRQEMDATVAASGVTVDGLKTEVLNVRMLPVGTVFRTFERTVRDVARQAGKQVRFETAGEDTEVDRRVLEDVSEALMHLVRNAADHGIESAAERRAAGKPEQGIIRLTARQEGSEVLFQIADDGRGIDHERLRAKVARSGRYAPEQVAAMSDAQIEELMFVPGISTREQVTDISGRGVGMDVVRTNVVERLKGSIDITTTPGRGTSFHLRVPLTVGVLTGLFLEEKGLLLCLPSTTVLEALRVRQSEIRWSQGVSMIEHRGEPIRAVSLARLLDLSKGEQREETWLNVLVLQHGDRRFGLIVDRVVSQRDVVVKSLGALLGRTPNLVGATILGDGRISIILDAAGLRRLAEGLGEAASVERAAVSVRRARERPRILVVEDSAFTREMLRNILEVAGYEAITAYDGMDALEKLAVETVDLVVADVEMPRMNGLDLTRMIRSKSEFRALPVVIVSARSTEEEKRQGLEAGADAYIVKGAFDQTDLVHAVGELIA
jgi:two-component system chemotaxis sensor kinase CheA